MDRFDIITALAALELALARVRLPAAAPGAGAARATEVFAEEPVDV